MSALIQNFLPLALGLWVGYVVAVDKRAPFDSVSGSVRVGIFAIVAFCATSLLRGLFGMFAPISSGATGGDSLANLLLGAILLVAVVRAYVVLGGYVPPRARAAVEGLRDRNGGVT